MPNIIPDLKGGVARAWRVLPVTHRMDQGGWDKITKGDFAAKWTAMECGLKDGHTWSSLASLVNGALPKSEFAPLADVPKHVPLTSLFVGTTVTVAKGGPVTNDAMWMAVQNKKLKKRADGGAVHMAGGGDLIRAGKSLMRMKNRMTAEPFAKKGAERNNHQQCDDQRGKLPVGKLRSGFITLEQINEGFDRLSEGVVLRQILQPHG